MKETEKKIIQYIEALNLLPKKELSQQPSTQYAEEYNKIRTSLISALGDHLPPEVHIHDDGIRKLAQARYIEILSYYKAIDTLLK